MHIANKLSKEKELNPQPFFDDSTTKLILQFLLKPSKSGLTLNLVESMKNYNFSTFLVSGITSTVVYQMRKEFIEPILDSGAQKSYIAYFQAKEYCKISGSKTPSSQLAIPFRFGYGCFPCFGKKAFEF